MFFASLTFNCKPSLNETDINSVEINKILQEFTEARIGQYIYSRENPKDNISILMQILKSHGHDYSNFLKAFKNHDNIVYSRLFPAQ